MNHDCAANEILCYCTQCGRFLPGAAPRTQFERQHGIRYSLQLWHSATELYRPTEIIFAEDDRKATEQAEKFLGEHGPAARLVRRPFGKSARIIRFWKEA